MPDLTVKDLKRALIDAGMEVFRVRDEEVHLAERQNVQLMEAGVRTRLGGTPKVTVVARAQRNDAPSLTDQVAFELVRQRLSALREAGYTEVSAETRELRSVSDPNQIIDVWYEVTFERPVGSLEEAVSETQRALAAERYVVPNPV